MQTLPQEYLLLFNALTDAEKVLRQLQASMIQAQQQAEELFLAADDHEAPAG